ncbi:MAG: porin family protein [Hymenobacter sp.]
MKFLAFPLAAALAAAKDPRSPGPVRRQAGINAAEMRSRDGESSSYKTYYHVGLIFQGNLIGPLSIQPEIQYSQQGGNLKGAFTDYDTKLHYFSVPVLLKATLGPVFVEAGPQFGLLVDATRNGEVEISGTSGSAAYANVDGQNVKDQYKKNRPQRGRRRGPQARQPHGGRPPRGRPQRHQRRPPPHRHQRPQAANRVFQFYAGIQFGK